MSWNNQNFALHNDFNHILHGLFEQHILHGNEVQNTPTLHSISLTTSYGNTNFGVWVGVHRTFLKN